MNLESTLAKLLEAWLDGGLSETEEAALLQQLGSDAELRRRFAEQVAMLGATRAAAEQSPRWLGLFDLLEHGDRDGGADILSFEDATMERIAPPVSRHWYQFAAVQALAAAVVLLLAASFLLKSLGPDDSAKTVATTAAPPISDMAVVVGTSPEAAQTVGTYLKPGIISQTSGWLTLQTLNGVAVTLDAPFQVELISHDRIRLNEGRARVHVPEGAEGFRLDSPAFDVVDLGTEFAAMVNADGGGTCRVFEGEADVSLLDSIGEVKRTQRLTANVSVRVNPSKQDMQVIEEADDDYPEMKHPPRITLALPHSYPAEVIGMRPLGYWRFEGIHNLEVANEVTDGGPLAALGSASIATESGGNHSGELIRKSPTEYFKIPSGNSTMFQEDFSISLFAQFEWLQNFTLLSAMRYDQKGQGHSFVLQSCAAYRRTGLNGTGLHAVLRDPPGWDGGVEVFGNTQLRPQHWHHIAATRKGEWLTLYLDGVVVGREPAGSMPLDCREIFVGRLNGNASQSRMEARGLVGRIDELAVFPRALSDDEIQKLAIPAK
ncbi:MAG: LamG-like jellyroll fold domain-containing protein [Akkermansiaceae bacterium]